MMNGKVETSCLWHQVSLVVVTLFLCVIHVLKLGYALCVR